MKFFSSRGAASPAAMVRTDVLVRGEGVDMEAAWHKSANGRSLAAPCAPGTRSVNAPGASPCGLPLTRANIWQQLDASQNLTEGCKLTPLHLSSLHATVAEALSPTSAGQCDDVRGDIAAHESEESVGSTMDASDPYTQSGCYDDEDVPCVLFPPTPEASPCPSPRYYYDMGFDCVWSSPLTSTPAPPSAAPVVKECAVDAARRLLERSQLAVQMDPCNASPQPGRYITGGNKPVTNESAKASPCPSLRYYHDTGFGGVRSSPPTSPPPPPSAAPVVKKCAADAARRLLERSQLAVQMDPCNASPQPGRYNTGGNKPVTNESAKVSQAIPAVAADSMSELKLSQLKMGGAEQRPLAVQWLSSNLWALSASAADCRAVQEAVALATMDERAMLAAGLKGHVVEGCQSPHASEVLQKLTEVLPPHQLQFMVDELAGQAELVARSRFGYKVILRLFEICPTQQTKVLAEQILRAAPKLFRHTSANFVVQHFIEHGTAWQRQHIVAKVVEDVYRLSRHRVASHIVRVALARCPRNERQMIEDVLRENPAEFSDLSHHHCGSFVVRELRQHASHL